MSQIELQDNYHDEIESTPAKSVSHSQSAN